MNTQENTQEPIIKIENVSMQFPGVLACDNVSLSLSRGEIFALVGENGAGKSTLMNILYGLHAPTAGSVYIKGQKVESFRPLEAIRRGVGMVHQHFMLVPSFTVAQNIVLSREPRKAKIFCDRKKALADVRQLSAEAQRLFAWEVRATDLYTLAYPSLSAARGGGEWREGPVIL